MPMPPNIGQPTIPSAKIYQDIGKAKELREASPSRGKGKFALGIARVERVDHYTHEISLQILTGQDDEFPHTAIPNTYPAAGNRHFLGALPQPGDLCVVGYLASNMPVILAWIPVSVTSGLEWLVTQDFLPTEVDFNPKTKFEWEGKFGRYRHKMRPMLPGNILLSSSQGSDILMDEGMLLTSRRLTEIRLRDQDQALVFRSQQQFHAMGGARVYAGMVQRDARLLPNRMVADQKNWTSKLQWLGGRPAFVPTSEEQRGLLTPHVAFKKSNPGGAFPDSGLSIPDTLDPYNFLARGLLIGPDGKILDPETMADVEYNGKPMFRVSYDPSPENLSKPTNGVTDTSDQTLTEYRIELNHTWDGRLPVNEQTDGFNVDGLPSNTDQSSELASNQPFIRWVLGSVVGNDPHTERGKDLYGIPLAPRVFTGDTPDPRLESGLGVPIEDHAASLFEIVSPVALPDAPTFVSFTKDGRLKASLGGKPTENSVEVNLTGGLKLATGGPIDLGGNSLNLKLAAGNRTTNHAFSVETETGSISLEAKAPTTQGSFSARVLGDELRESSFPALLLVARNGSAFLTSDTDVKISGTNAIQLVDTNSVDIIPKQSTTILSERVSIQGNTVQKVVQGKEDNLYSGPKNFLPTNLPVRRTVFAATPATGHAGGPTDSYLMVFGDRQERFITGNHTTDIVVGNTTYRTGVGVHTSQAGTNIATLSSVGGYQVTTTVGPIQLTSTSAANVVGVTAVSMTSAGPARVAGSVVILGAPGKVGPIVSGADLDPLTGLPLAVLGLGSPGHLLGA